MDQAVIMLRRESLVLLLLPVLTGLFVTGLGGLESDWPTGAAEHLKPALTFFPTQTWNQHFLKDLWFVLLGSKTS